MDNFQQVPENLIIGLLLGRTLMYRGEYFALDTLTSLFPGTQAPARPKTTKKEIEVIRDGLISLYRRDAENILQGVYPASVLWPESGPRAHLKNLGRLLIDGVDLYRRRAKGQTARFKSKSALSAIDEQALPKYYQRNFHFQTDGYLSDHSARIYDQQVEMLFAGAAASMRRMILPSLKKFANTERALQPPTQKRHLRILEIAAGTGSASVFVKKALPKERLTLTDLSGNYLKAARNRLKDFDRVDFVQANAESLPFTDESFDAVYSVYLFHELPLEARKAVIRESLRILRPGGYFGLVDSIQKHDDPDFQKNLEAFPKSFHEPFYQNYIENPLEALLADAGLRQVQTEQALFSKVMYGVKT